MHPYKRSGFIFCYLFISCIVYMQCAPVKKGLTGKNNGKVIFFDDFSGEVLDRSKWNVQVTGFHVNNEQQAYVDSSVTLYLAHGPEAEGAQNGALVLQPHYAPGFVTKDGKHFDFSFWSYRLTQ